MLEDGKTPPGAFPARPRGPFAWGAGGHYDENGTWVRTKFCFISCGDRCDCTPPGGVYQLPVPEAKPEP